MFDEMGFYAIVFMWASRLRRALRVVNRVFSKLNNAKNTSGVVRPLLAGPDAEANVVRLLAERTAHYRRFEQVDTDGLTPVQVVAEIRRRISPAVDNG